MMRIVHSPQSIVHRQRSPTSLRAYELTSYFLYAIFLIFFILPLSAHAATYYVVTNGDDANPGTLEAPFRNIQKGVDTVQAGDTLYVRAGTYHEAVEIKKSGTAGAPITISGYPGERPVIDGNYTLPGGTVVHPGKGLDYVYGPLVGIEGNYTTVQRLEVMRSLGRGIHVSGSWDTRTRTHHNEIIDCWVHGSRETGVLVWYSDYNLVQNCRIWDNCAYNTNDLADNWPGGLVMCQYCIYATFRGNEVFHNWGEGIMAEHAVDGVIIEDNVVYDNFAAGIYCERASNVTIQRNLVYNTNDPVFRRGGNPSSGIGFCDENDGYVGAWGIPGYTRNETVANNLVMGNWVNFYWGVGELGGEGGLANSLIAYNTFVNAKTNPGTSLVATGMSIEWDGVHTNCRIENNIILQDEGDATFCSNAAVQFSNNLWSRAPEAVATNNNAVIGNPQLVMSGPTGAGLLTADYFKIKESSPAKDKAKVITEVTKDFFGNIRGGAPDIGAHEFVSTPIKYGDVSGDGTVSAYDAALTAQAAVGLITLTSQQTQAADVSGDGQVTAYDAALIAQKTVGLIDKFPVEE